MDLDAHDPRAQRVHKALTRFVTSFEQRAPADHATDVLYDDAVLDGREIGQAPERFVEEHLIEPVAEALGYTYRPQPKGFSGLGGRIPDFTVLNAEPTVIGEIKKPNQIENAREESVEYLTMATDRPVVGIATDGWTWIIHRADESEDPTYSDHVPLRGVLKDIAREERHERASGHDSLDLRDRCTDFTEAFGVSEL